MAGNRKWPLKPEILISVKFNGKSGVYDHAELKKRRQVNATATDKRK